MVRNFLKINIIEYRMVSDPNETDQVMIDNGVTDAQFDKAFNLYRDLQNHELPYNDILKKIEAL
ncbi:hypothetical protein HP548_11905 [Paenibacillus taichungensis]|uniref:Uncharacterized protein n=1 Tax=Paenibacillus taichungensis TaxID=484184 RepID=A0ABX2ML81_9BACL|nr:hypothetical protein [Paenibacillus taichungensis]NUU54782.1 hypothetical protein [Paenibacillus taichungensis]